MKITEFLRLFLSILLLTGIHLHSLPQAVPGTTMPPEVLFLVDTFLDSNAATLQNCQPDVPADCSLRGAISHANSEPLISFTILLPPGTYHLSLPGDEDDNLAGDLDVYGNVAIDQQLPGDVLITTDGLGRVLQVFPGAAVEINNLFIARGQAGPAQSGGGIHNAGSLALVNVVIADNRAGDGRIATLHDLNGEPGGSGGGILNLGELKLLGCTVSGNQAGAGGDTLPEYTPYPKQTGGLGGAGGGIANRGSLEIVNSIIRDNRAGAGGCGTSTYTPPWQLSSGGVLPGMLDGPANYNDAGNGGDGGTGGGVFNGNLLTIRDSQVTGNQSGPGGAGGVAWVSGGWGGRGGDGGGISNHGWFQAQTTIIALNQSGLSGPSGAGDYKQGNVGSRGPGFGGGVYNANQAELIDCQVNSNTTAPEVKENYGYRIAHGGGIYNDRPGKLALKNCAVDHNFASGSGGGILNLAGLTLTGGEVNANQARSLGGGIYNDGQLEGSQFSLSNNQAGPGYDGYQSWAGIAGLTPPTDGDTPGGGGMYNAGDAWLASVRIDNNIAGNGGKGGDHADLGYWQWPAGDGGHGGFGGGIENPGRLELYLSTLIGNQTGQGGLGGTSNYGNGLNGDGGPGGAIYNCGRLKAAFLTIAGNQTGQGATATEDGGSGGGLINTGNLSFRDSQVSGNRTSPGGVGGGIAVIRCGASTTEPLVSNTRVTGNHAGGNGGGIYISDCNARLENLVFANNQTDSQSLGSGLFQNNGDTYFRHLTIAGNYGGDGSGVYLLAGTAVYTNTILAGQMVGIYLTETAQARFRTTLWGADSWANGQDWGGAGMLDRGMNNPYGDPHFLDPVNDDFHLSQVSPAVKAGQTTDLSFDLDNQPRPQLITVLPDIGADEVWTLIPMTGLLLTEPKVITATLPVEFSAEVGPARVTPNISFLWSPPPQSGQWTNQVVYVFDCDGKREITVWAIQAGQVISRTSVVTIQPMIRYLYFPLIGR
jgi:hypothetical protein